MKFHPLLPAGALLVSGFSAKAATVTEYFNDYGTANIGLVAGSLNGGTGWSGGWQGGAATSYRVGNNTAYSGAGYSNAGNDNADGNDGVATGSGTGTISYRTFATPLTGTVWISAQVFQSTDGDVLFWLDKTDTGVGGGSRDYVGLRGTTGTSSGTTPEAVATYEAGDDVSSAVDFPANTPHLLLMRIDMNFSGALDRLSFWVDPNLTGGIGGLGTPLYLKDTLDAYGTGFDGIGLSMSASTNTLDAIRASNEPDGFEFVISGVPEPASGAMALLGAVLLVTRRRK